MFYKVLSSTNVVELQNLVNEHINSGYTLQGGVAVETKTGLDFESGPIAVVPGRPVTLGTDRAHPDRWIALTGAPLSTYFQAVAKSAVVFNPSVGLSPHTRDN